jgi:hypothetical protein
MKILCVYLFQKFNTWKLTKNMLGYIVFQAASNITSSPVNHRPRVSLLLWAWKGHGAWTANCKQPQNKRIIEIPSVDVSWWIIPMIYDGRRMSLCHLYAWSRLCAVQLKAPHIEAGQRGSADVDVSKVLKNRGEPADKNSNLGRHGSSFLKPIKYPAISLVRPSYFC